MMTTDLPLGDDGRDVAERVAELAAALGHALASRGLIVTSAESCTGGLVAGAITEVAGSSDWFAESVVTYSNEAKRARLGVAEATLDAHGAVSEAVVREMAEGARTRAGADLAIAVSGIAGPGGAVPGKPVGTVWIAVAGGVATDAVRHRFHGDRGSVRRQAVVAALRASLARLTSESR